MPTGPDIGEPRSNSTTSPSSGDVLVGAMSLLSGAVKPPLSDSRVASLASADKLIEGTLDDPGRSVGAAHWLAPTGFEPGRGAFRRPGRCCQFGQGDAPLAAHSIQARTHFGQDGS